MYLLQLPVLIKLVVSTSRINYKKHLSFPKNLSVCTFGDSRHISLMMETEILDLCPQLMKILPTVILPFSVFAGSFKMFISTIYTLKAFYNRGCGVTNYWKCI